MTSARHPISDCSGATRLAGFFADVRDQSVTLFVKNDKPRFTSTEKLRELAQKHGATILTPPPVLQPEIRRILEGCCAYVRVHWARQDDSWLADEVLMGRQALEELDDRALIEDFVQNQGFEELKREEWMPVFRTRAVRQAFINGDAGAAGDLLLAMMEEAKAAKATSKPPAFSKRMLAWAKALNQRHSAAVSSPEAALA